jgi:hypothetical protein
MPFFHSQVHQLLVEPIGIGQAMQRLIDIHAQDMPSGNWQPYRELPFDSEVSRLARDWFPRVIADDPPLRVPVKGLFFGLFEPIIDGEAVADFYVGGSSRFEIDSEWDWAVRPAYFPELRYANSPILAGIYRLAYGQPDGLKNDAEESLCLGFVAFSAKQFLAEADYTLIVPSNGSVGVAVGWDSGTPLYIGEITPDGFKVRDAAEAIVGIEKRDKELEELLGKFDEDF